VAVMIPGRNVVQCNIREATKIYPAGAKAYLVISNPGNGHERIVILGRSYGGRWIEKWERIDNLRDFRAKTLPPEHPFYDNDRIWDVVQDVAATDIAAQLQEIAVEGWAALEARRLDVREGRDIGDDALPSG
jgi:hypothetical protein